jgi:long-chain fatty acid transport protein
MEISMKTFFVTAALGLAGAAQAAGYQVDTQAARATGMATAVTSQIDDASSVLYNAAGMVNVKGLDVELGDTVIAPSYTYQPPGGGASTGSKTSPLPPVNFYAVYGLSNDVSFGVGFFSLYGNAVDWPTDWAGRYFATDVSLQTFDINPTVAVRVFDWIRLGLGADAVRGVVDIKRAINFVDTDGTSELGGSTWGGGVNAGVQLDILPKTLTFGAQYRSQVSLGFTGVAHFSGQPPELQNTLKDQSVSTTFTLPDSLQLGLAYVPIEHLTVAFDADWTNWSTLQAININFADPTLAQSQYKNWRARWNFHIGGEYAINEQLRVRAGILIDPTPSPSYTLTPDLPDFNRVNIAVGAGYRWHQFQADLGYQLAILLSNTSTADFGGTYSGTAQVVGLSLSYRM